MARDSPPCAINPDSKVVRGTPTLTATLASLAVLGRFSFAPVIQPPLPCVLSPLRRSPERLRGFPRATAHSGHNNSQQPNESLHRPRLSDCGQRPWRPATRRRRPHLSLRGQPRRLRLTQCLHAQPSPARRRHRRHRQLHPHRRPAATSASPATTPAPPASRSTPRSRRQPRSASGSGQPCSRPHVRIRRLSRGPDQLLQYRPIRLHQRGHHRRRCLRVSPAS